MPLFVKIYFIACKKPHANFQYAYNICAKFKIDCLKTLGVVDYKNLLPYVAVENAIILSKYVCAKFKNDCLKTIKVDCTKFFKARQTDGQGQNIMPPDYHHVVGWGA